MCFSENMKRQLLSLDFISRKKVFTEETMVSTKLSRVLSLMDVFAIGMGFTLGAGIYIMAGTVIRDFSGPATLISFIIAGIGTFFSGLSYAELGSRVPRSGSAFVYIYVTIGEFAAFVMGWDLILEYMIGTASNANALSGYVNALAGNSIQNFLARLTPMNVPQLAPYVDFLAFAITMIVTGLLIIGVKESTFLNKIFTILNIFALVFLTIAGATRTNPENWRIDPKNVSWIENNQTQTCETSGRCGSGGFLPFGVNGLIGGAAKCFYSFIGFDAIASTGEELQNPKRNIPLSIFLTVFITAIIYCGLSVVLTFMVPYFLIDPNIPLTFSFRYVGMYWCEIVASVAAIFSLSTCVYSGMYPLPRIVYTMSADGLIFSPFAKVLARQKTPWVSTLVTGIISGIMAAIFDLSQLIEMLSIGTLMAYTFVSICVLILRYRPDEYVEMLKESDNQHNLSRFRPPNGTSFIRNIFNVFFDPQEKEPSLFTSRISNILIFLSVIHAIVITILVAVVRLTQTYLIIIVVLLALNLLFMCLSLYRQPVTLVKSAFMTPLLPFLPILSIFTNIYMMTALTTATWLRFVIWFAIGLVLYFGYGRSNSLENKNRANEYRCLCIPCIGSVKRSAVKPIQLDEPKPSEFEMNKVEKSTQ